MIYPFDVQLKPSRFAGQMVIITEKGDLVEMRGGITATYKSWVIFMEGSKSRERGTLQAVNERPKYSKEEIDEIYQAQDKEVPGIGKMSMWAKNFLPSCVDPIPLARSSPGLWVKVIRLRAFQTACSASLPLNTVRITVLTIQD